jgi:anti-anti-sigma regulatory factor
LRCTGRGVNAAVTSTMEDDVVVDVSQLDFAAVTSTMEGDVVVDVSQLDFVDRRSLRLLGRHAEAHGKHVVLRAAKPIVQRLVESGGVVHVTAMAT